MSTRCATRPRNTDLVVKGCQHFIINYPRSVISLIEILAGLRLDRPTFYIVVNDFHFFIQFV